MVKDYIIETVEQAVDFIEDNLYNKISLASISSNIYTSKFYMLRIFKALTQKSIIDYARGRKLTQSIDDLLYSSQTIKNISEKYGFEYEVTFSRAFKSEFGVSPNEFRREPISLEITPKANLGLLNELQDSIILKPTYCYKPSFNLCGIRHKVTFDENIQNNRATSLANDFYYNKKHLILNPINPHIYYGLTHWNESPNGYTYYLTAVEVKDTTSIPEGYNLEIIPSANYSVYKFIGLFSPEQITHWHLDEIYVFMHKNLLVDKSVDYTNGFSFEYVDKSICSENYCELDLYIPVV